MDFSKLSQEDARALLRQIIGPETKTITGTERDHLLLVLALKEPFNSSNNQRTWTDEYEHAGNTYHLTYGLDENDPLVEQILD
jgi:hypothetical protein